MSSKTTLPKEELKRLTAELSDAALSYTLMYIKKKNAGKIWSVQNQILHTHSELSEVYEEIRDDVDLNRLVHEIIDVIFSAFTLSNIVGLTYFEDDFKEFKENIISEVVEKITTRLD